MNFWFGKRVLVTGGYGFVASHLVRALLARGAVVVAAVRHKRPVNAWEMLSESMDPSGVRSMVDIEECNLLDLSSVRRLCEVHQIDTIFHLAASAIVSDAANAPFSTVENNIMSTLNVLEAARINRIPRVLVISSDKSYGDHAAVGDWEPLPYTEQYALRGLDVYSASKVCTDMLAQAYAYQFNAPVIVVRPCNIFGPGDLNFTRLIPKTIMCLLGGTPPVIHEGNEHVLREHMYVDDAVDAYLFLLENVHELYGQDNRHMPRRGTAIYGWCAFNVGTYDRQDLADVRHCYNIKSVSQIIGALRSLIHDIAPVVKEKPVNFIEIPDQYLDASKLRALGFKTRVPFDEGLRRSVAWYTHHYKHLEKIAFKHVHA